MKQRPYISFYQQDFLSSIDVKIMSATEVGCYCLLLFNCYNNDGQIPGDEEALKVLCHGTVPSKRVLKKFYANAQGYLQNKRVDEEILKREKFSKEMKKAAKRRWDAERKAMRRQ